jgi:hypothetical protein
MQMTEVKDEFGKRAEAWATDRFIHVDTCSGYGCCRIDVRGAHISLAPSVDSESLGKAVVMALSKSRVLNVDEVDAFFDLQTTEREYEEWVQNLMNAYGYRTRRALFKTMKHCSLRNIGGTITFGPSNHEKLEGWGREAGDGIEDVVIPENSDFGTIGIALQEAFRRCK